MLKRISILCDNKEFKKASSWLAERLQIPLIDAPDHGQFDFYLVYVEDRLELHSATNLKLAPFYIDYLHGAMEFRCRQGGGRRQPLARAIGLQPHYNPTVLDAMAGLGRESWILANLGCSVTMLERSPIVAQLLADGLQRAFQQQPLSIKLIETDASQYLKSLTQLPDVIYLDPMFPEKPKVALVKKEMQILQQLAIETDNSVEVFNLALQKVKHRVVVKRPQWAPSIRSDIKPNGVIKTKRYRFEIFVPLWNSG